MGVWWSEDLAFPASGRRGRTLIWVACPPREPAQQLEASQLVSTCRPPNPNPAGGEVQIRSAGAVRAGASESKGPDGPLPRRPLSPPDVATGLFIAPDAQLSSGGGTRARPRSSGGGSRREAAPHVWCLTVCPRDQPARGPARSSRSCSEPSATARFGAGSRFRTARPAPQRHRSRLTARARRPAGSSRRHRSVVRHWGGRRLRKREEALRFTLATSLRSRAQ